MIIAPAIRTKDNEVFASRYYHAEILRKYPKKFNGAEQGFITDALEFVDRKKACEIAKKNNQIKFKHGSDDELYSEDLFMQEYFENEKIREVNK